MLGMGLNLIRFFKKDVHINSSGNHLLADEILNYISDWANDKV